jgi:hypothetical protein
MYKYAFTLTPDPKVLRDRCDVTIPHGRVLGECRRTRGRTWCPYTCETEAGYRHNPKVESLYVKCKAGQWIPRKWSAANGTIPEYCK